MKPWKFVKVFGALIPVFKTKNLIETFEAYGCWEIVDTRTDKQHILLDAGMKGDELMQTLLHELFHACLHRTNTEVANEEAVVDQLARAVVENFRLHWRK